MVSARTASAVVASGFCEQRPAVAASFSEAGGQKPEIESTLRSWF